jgi:hypothetical protein
MMKKTSSFRNNKSFKRTMTPGGKGDKPKGLSFGVPTIVEHQIEEVYDSQDDFDANRLENHKE